MLFFRSTITLIAASICSESIAEKTSIAFSRYYLSTSNASVTSDLISYKKTAKFKAVASFKGLAYSSSLASSSAILYLFSHSSLNFPNYS